MARRSIAAAAVVASVLAGTMTAASAATAHGRSVYIQIGYHRGRQLIRLDRTTLLPLAKPIVALGDATDGRALAPDGRTLALGADTTGKVYVVDLARFQPVRTIQVVHRKRFLNPQLAMVAWPRPHLLIGYSQHFEAHESTPARVVLIDPQARHSVRRIALHGSVVVADHTRGGRAVFIVSPVTHVGASRLVVVGRSGTVRSVELRIAAGFVDSGEAPESQDLRPGLAVNDTRALIVGLHHTVASVNLHSLDVTYHRVPQLLHARLAEEPPGDCCGSAGALHSIDRFASHLGDHQLLVTGSEQDPVPGKNELLFVQRAASIVDLRTWRVRHVFPDVDRLIPVRSLYIGEAESLAGHHAQRITLKVFRHNGSVVTTIPLRRNQTWRIIGDRLFVGGISFPSAAVELDPRTGRRIRILARSSKWQSLITIWTPPTP